MDGQWQAKLSDVIPLTSKDAPIVGLMASLILESQKWRTTPDHQPGQSTATPSDSIGSKPSLNRDSKSLSSALHVSTGQPRAGVSNNGAKGSQPSSPNSLNAFTYWKPEDVSDRTLAAMLRPIPDIPLSWDIKPFSREIVRPLNSTVGQGAIGTVYQGHIIGHSTPIIAKLLPVEQMDLELGIWRKLRHLAGNGVPGLFGAYALEGLEGREDTGALIQQHAGETLPSVWPETFDSLNFDQKVTNEEFNCKHVHNVTPRSIVQNVTNFAYGIKDEQRRTSQPQIPSMQNFDAAVQKCAGGIIEFFHQLNGQRAAAEDTLDDTPAMLETFDDFQDAISKSVRRQMVAWLRPRNSLLPIHNLPIELIQHILRFALFASNGRRRHDYVSKLNTLRAVSWTWRDLIDRTPAFWTQISSQDHIDFAFEAFQKSQNYPLQLKCVGTMDYESLSPFLDMAVEHLGRWEYIVLKKLDSDLIIKEYFLSPAPRLKGLAFSKMIPSGLYAFQQLGPFLGAEFTNLQELRAVQCDFIGGQNVHFQRLKLLEIEGLWLEWEVLFGILSGNHDLQELRIDRTAFRQYIHPPSPPQPIVLSRLTRLTLTYLEEAVGEEAWTTRFDVPIRRILAQVQTPVCASFEVQTASPNPKATELEDLFNLIPRPMDILSREESANAVKSTPMATVTLWEGDFECQAFWTPKSSTRFRLLVKGAYPNVGIGWARREFVDAWTESKKPDIRLRLWMDDEGVNVETIKRLQDVETVVELDVIGNSLAEAPVAADLGKILSTPAVSDTGSIVGPFLGLRRLRMSSCGIAGRDIARIVTERYARVISPRGTVPQSSSDAQPSGSEEIEGITVILGEGMERLSRSTTRDIRAAPGVKDCVLCAEIGLRDDDARSSTLSEGSDWAPQFEADDNDATDLGSVDGFEDVEYDIPIDEAFEVFETIT
ncbi:hypothetical protein FRB90_011197 [Tulasnella sp. 427]|nr:hypothetical protein FRB90_011197 [Tulasnella sp. 427]